MSLSIYIFHTLHDTTLGQGRKCHFQGIFFLHYMIPLKGKMSFSDYFFLTLSGTTFGKGQKYNFHTSFTALGQ